MNIFVGNMTVSKEMRMKMVSRMKNDIAQLKNAKVGKDIRKYTIAPMFIWMLIWIMNDAKKNFIGEEIALTIIFLAALCGCITALISRKNKIFFILFKVISAWMVSLGALCISYTVYYLFLKWEGILFFGVTLSIYLAIFISTLIMVINKTKQKEVRKQEKSNKAILALVPIFVIIGYFIIGPVINKSSQFTISVVLIFIFTLLSYVLVACTPYYLVEYMIAKKCEAKRKK